MAASRARSRPASYPRMMPTATQVGPTRQRVGKGFARESRPARRRRLTPMSLSESEFYEAGMSLPPDVRKHVALRLLESVDPYEAFDMASESWLRTQAAAAYDALKADPSQAIPAEDVRAGFEAKWAARP